VCVQAFVASGAHAASEMTAGSQVWDLQLLSGPQTLQTWQFKSPPIFQFRFHTLKILF